MSTKRIKFASKLGLIAAAAGSAVGLGNIWRFPSQVADGGGALFILLYTLLWNTIDDGRVYYWTLG